MTRSGRRAFHASLFADALLLLTPIPARAQVRVLGKGWLFDSGGSITSAPGEVISGTASIEGSYSGPDANPGIGRSFLNTNPSFIRFTPFATYTITFNYRVISAGSHLDATHGIFTWAPGARHLRSCGVRLEHR